MNVLSLSCDEIRNFCSVNLCHLEIGQNLIQPRINGRYHYVSLWLLSYLCLITKLGMFPHICWIIIQKWINK